MEIPKENDTIKVTDIVSMFKTIIKKNEGMLTAKVIELNNKKVDMWKVDMLDKMAENGNVNVIKATTSWDVYEEGNDVRNSIDML